MTTLEGRGSASQGNKRIVQLLGLALVLAFLIAIRILVALDLPHSYENSLLLGFLNTLFLGIIPIIIAYVAMRVYTKSGSVSFFLIGSGILIFGLGSIAAGLVNSLPGGPNMTVTIHNTCACIGSVFILAGAVMSLYTPAFRRGTVSTGKLTAVYAGIVVFVTFFSLATVEGVVPPFFIPGTGPTILRQIILEDAVVFFTISSVLFMYTYQKRKTDFFFWFSVSLALIATGLLAVFFQPSVGSFIGWVGRTAQYLGCVFALYAVLIARQAATVKGISIDEVIANFFVDAEQNYRQLVETATDAIVTLNEDYRVLMWNAAAEKMFGYRRDEAIGSSFPDLAIDGQYTAVIKNNDEGISGSQDRVPEPIEIIARRKDGTLFPVELTISRRMQEGRMIRTCILRDITERKMAERERAHLAAIVESSGEAVIGKTLDGTITSWNAGAERTYGYSAQEVIGKNISLLVPPGHTDDTREILKKIGIGEAVIRYETLRRKKDGGQIDVMLTVSPVMDEQDHLIGASSIAHDITGRKRVDEALRETTEYLENLFRYANAPIIVWNPEMEITRFNHAFEDLTGLNGEQVTGKNLEILFPPDSRTASIELIKKALSGEKWKVVEIPILNVISGEVKTVLWNSANIMSPDGITVLATIAQGQDITERKVAEEALQESNAYLNNLFDYANAPIIVWNPAFEITRFNHAFEELTGRTGQQVIGKRLEILFPPDSCDASMDLIQKALAGERWEIEEIPILNVISGEVRIVLWNSANIMSPDGTTVLATIAQGQDITERKELENETKFHEQELMQFSTALATANKKLNLLSSITRHDINNQLMSVNGFLELLQEKVPDPGLLDYFTRIARASSRISAMIRFTKEYENIGVSVPAWQDCRLLVETAAKEAPLGTVIVRNDLPAGNEMFADPMAVKVFYNLMENAAHYGGKITTVRFFVMEHGGEEVIICEDDGDGVPANEKEKIFERGFGKNTGMGLFLSREILAITGITIRETGEPGKGARFEMQVPKGMWR